MFHLRQKKHCDETSKPNEFDDAVEIVDCRGVIGHVVAVGLGFDELGGQHDDHIEDGVPEGHQRHKVVELVGPVHHQAQ